MVVIPDAHKDAREDVAKNGPIAVGLSKGHPTTQRASSSYKKGKPFQAVRPADTKGVRGSEGGVHVVGSERGGRVTEKGAEAWRGGR